jgi:hypothetical protein
MEYPFSTLFPGFLLKKQESCQLSVVSKSLMVLIYSQFSEGPFECRSMPSAFKITAGLTTDN